MESDDEMDSPSGFTEEQKYQNYLQLIRAIRFIENRERITEDWMEDNKSTILRWRDWIEDFTTLNAEVEDETFRKKCRDAETIMQYLCHSIRTQKTFDPKTYLIFLHHVKYICDTLFTDAEMEEMMSMLSM
jgi:hypothetical protein